MSTLPKVLTRVCQKSGQNTKKRGCDARSTELRPQRNCTKYVVHAHKLTRPLPDQSHQGGMSVYLHHENPCQSQRNHTDVHVKMCIAINQKLENTHCTTACQRGNKQPWSERNLRVAPGVIAIYTDPLAKTAKRPS